MSFHNTQFLKRLEQAIDALGKLRNEDGIDLDSYPEHIQKARGALWVAYHKESLKHGNPSYRTWQRKNA